MSIVNRESRSLTPTNLNYARLDFAEKSDNEHNIEYTSICFKSMEGIIKLKEERQREYKKNFIDK